MKKNLREQIREMSPIEKIVSAFIVVAGINAFGICYFTFRNVKEADVRIPQVRENQSLILHPDYLNGTASLGYTLLTDIDSSGSWDIVERYHAGFTTGDYTKKLYFKKGFGPAQSIDAEFEFVEPEFFKPYQ